MTEQTLEITGLMAGLADDATPSRGLSLRIETGSAAGRELALGLRGVRLGSAGDCDLVLLDPGVSRQHVAVRAGRGGVIVRDLESRNGTRVGGALVLEARVPAGGTFDVAGVTVRVLEASVARLPPSTATSFGGLIGGSLAMREVFAVLERAAVSHATILLQGESGTGKEVAARSIHEASPRSKKPFVAFDCGSVSKDLLPSALMGHRKGAFTGAHADRAGAFVEAHGGTLFLDEIGELPLDAQTHLLRVLETAEVTAVGDDRSRKVDVRLVAATNRQLFAMVEKGTFRLDLFHRLAIVQVRLPPLHERREDIPAIVRGLYARRGLDPGPIEGPNLQALLEHPFGGNVRELRNALERSWVLAAPGATRFTELVLWLGEPGPTTTGEGAAVGAADAGPAINAGRAFKDVKDDEIERVERAYLVDLLRRFPRNLSAAARHAGLSRLHLRTLLQKHGLRGDDDG
jgi:DNA-binding NtrC family response regulator